MRGQKVSRLLTLTPVLLDVCLCHGALLLFISFVSIKAFFFLQKSKRGKVRRGEPGIIFHVDNVGSMLTKCPHLRHHAV